MKQVVQVISLLLLLIGCDAALDEDSLSDASISDSSVSSDAASDCLSVKFRFNFNGDEEIQFFPSDLFTQPDLTSPTGLRLLWTPEAHPWMGLVPSLVAPDPEDYTQLSGFARNGSVLLRFDGPLPETLPVLSDSTADDHFIWLDLDSVPPKRIPFEVKETSDGSGLIFDPYETLAAGHRQVVLVKKDSWSPEHCVRETEDFAAFLSGTEHSNFGVSHAKNSIQEALSQLGVDVNDVAAVTSFTTHKEHMVMKAVADHISSQTFEWSENSECEDDEYFRVCETSFQANDYRRPKAIFDSTPTATWTLKARVFFPLQGEAPFPVLIYGHGLNSDRFEGDRLAKEFCQNGFAIIAVDALKHGDHPTRIDENALPALEFLGVSIIELKVDSANLSGNLTQTVADRLQLLQLLKTQPDMDGDGTPDFKTDKIGYFGVSLGGMLGSIFLANSTDVPLAVLSISGGHLIRFLTDSPLLGQYRPILNNIAGGDAKFERLLVFAQTMVDRADPATYGPYVLRNRYDAENNPPPHLMMPVADQDETVPPGTAHVLARSIGLPHVGYAFTDVFGLETIAAPASLNGENGKTIGYFQFDRITRRNDRVEIAEHAKLPESPEALLQCQEFLTPWREDEAPVIIDPYETLETPPLQ